MAFKDEAYKTGCGRYIQRSGALELCGTECARLGAQKVLILGGKTALSLTRDKITASLQAAGIGWEEAVHTGLCCRVHAQQYLEQAKQTGCTLILGVGGGTVLDLAKITAAMGGLPVICLPTSAATCSRAASMALRTFLPAA